MTSNYDYRKQHGYSTVVMGASFRNIEEIKQLAGCDLLTIAPQLLGELDATMGDLSRKLSPQSAKLQPMRRLILDRQTFERMHKENAMAADQPTLGIDGFSSALKALEVMLATRLSMLHGG